MYVSATSMRLLRGRSTPASRAIVYSLTLPLLMPRVLADHADDSPPLDHLALVANLFDRRAHFHLQTSEMLPRAGSFSTRAITTRSPGLTRTITSLNSRATCATSSF